MAHLHELRDMDTHFVIDPVTRAITNPNSQKNKLMQGDHNSEIYTFEIPKLVEGHDMSLCNQVRIHYNDIASDKANESKDVYTVNDLHIDIVESDTITFSWLISGNATKYAGLLSFRIQFLCIDESGAITYKWHTEVFKGITISDGFDNTPADLEEYSDILAAWEVRLDALEEGGSGVEVTAKPGQLIRVKETDENGKPTAWEAVPWGYTEGGMVEILSETTVALEEEGIGELPMLNLVAGETYVVNWNGTEYSCVAQLPDPSDEAAVALGNMVAVGQADTGEPFAMITIANVLMVLALDGTVSTEVTISIKGIGEISHPIPGELLPEGVPYVYKDYILEETDAVETTDPNYGKIWVIQNPPTVTAGETYTVIYNGVMYDCVGLDNSSFAEGAVALGNASVVGGANTGEPFAMVIVPNYAVICMDLAGAASVRIGIMGKVGHKIDPMCLPVLTVTVDTFSMTADKTYDEIYTAVKDGRTVLLFYGDDIGSFVSASTYDVCFVVSRTTAAPGGVAKVTKTFVIVNESGTVDTWEQ